MVFKFKIWDHIKQSWPIYKAHFSILLLLSAVTIIIKSTGADSDLIWTLISYIVGFLLTFIWIKYSLSLVDKKEYDFFTNASIPNLKQYWNITKTIILTVLIIIVGLFLLILPGLYFAGRLLFANYISVEKNQGAIKSISDSWEMTRNNGWILFWKSFVIFLFVMLGFVLFGVGALVTYPIGCIVLAMMYRDFQKNKLIKNNDKEEDNKAKVEKIEVEKVIE